MGDVASARRHLRPRARFLVGALVVAAFLAVAPQVHAEAGQDAAAAAAPAESGTAEAASPAADDGATSAPKPEHPAGAGSTAADEPAGEPAAERPGAAPPSAQGQGAGASSAAEADQSASVEQAVGADAAAEQQEVGNVAATVRVEEPGNGAPIAQENRAAADARSAATAVVDSPGEAAVDQSARAHAYAAQADVSNTAVVVRVGSAGDDAGVSQANVAAGAAAASASDVASARASDASAVARQDDVANTSVSVRVFSPGDDGPVTQLNVASAEAQAGRGTESAVASQNGVRNTAVSIRVESPGSSAAPTQESHADANASMPEGEDGAAVGGAAVAVTNDAVNTVLTVAVGGPTLDRPGPSGLQVWVWTWVWEHDESENVDDVFQATVGSWNWDWTAGGPPPHGSVTSRAADPRDTHAAGSWEWVWNWDRGSVPSWSWNWNWASRLSCASCIWIWNWSWSWTGTPAGSTAAVSPLEPVEATASRQLNAVEASALASASAQVTQGAAQDATGAGSQLAGQLAAVAQAVYAVATARQENVVSLAWGLDRPAESNAARSNAHAAVSATLTQHSAQSVDAREGASADQWAGQQGDIAQLGRAQAAVSQRDLVLTAPGAHAATGTAIAHGDAGVDQSVRQAALAGGGALSQWIGQLALVEQAVDAAASVVQAGSPRSSRQGGRAAASAVAQDLAFATQSAEQTAVRLGGIGAQSIWQLALVSQDASARATTIQRVGTASAPTAASAADALNRAAVVQDAWQAALGSAAFDLQDVVQEAVVFQTATATSTSGGGLAGLASVFNCAVAYQGSAQSLGAGSPPSAGGGLGSFCIPAPAAEPPISSSVVPPDSSAAGGQAPPFLGASASVAAAAAAVELPQPAGAEPSTAAAAGPTMTARRAAPGRAAPPAHGPARLSPDRSGVNQVSVPHSTQARIDTRPGSRAGSGDAGRESPLPPAGDPPSRVFVPPAGAAGAGSSGIAAILFAFALVPPHLLRAPEGSVVRRPTSVLAWSDVPI